MRREHLIEWKLGTRVKVTVHVHSFKKSNGHGTTTLLLSYKVMKSENKEGKFTYHADLDLNPKHPHAKSSH